MPHTDNVVQGPTFSTLPEGALWWADQGVPVFPLHGIVETTPGARQCTCNEGTGCDDPGKHPRIAGWQNAATTDPDQIREWWTQWPDANIGAVTGDGLTVIDVDSHEGELNLRDWNFPRTLEVKTARGRHLYYIEPEDFSAGNTQGGRGKRTLGYGIDTRGTGGYVVTAPSRHVSGKNYKLKWREPVELPSNVAARLTPEVEVDNPIDLEVPDRRAATPSANAQFATMLTMLCERIRVAKGGRRHKRILSGVRDVAGYYHMQDGLDIEEVFRYIDEAVIAAYAGTSRKMQGGLRTARDAWRDGISHPWKHMPGQLSTTPDGRPYLISVDGRRGMFVATANGRFVYQDSTMVVARLSSEWPGIRVWVPKVSGDGDRPMNLQEAFKRYGDAYAANVEYTYDSEMASTFDEDTGTIRIGPRFADPPKAIYHEDIAAWLSRLPSIDPDHVKLLDWLATFPDIMRPTAALVITGKGSVGKQMLVLGLARYFGVSPVSYDIAVSRFNEVIRHSPVLWLDETTRELAKSGQFRRLVANDSHPIEGKNKPPATLLGCPRLLAFANNPDPFGLAREDLTLSDEEAIGERLLHIAASPAAAAYLERIGGRQTTEHEGWLDKIAQHVAWLHANRQVTWGSRLLVQGDSARWSREVGATSGLPGQIVQLLEERWEKIVEASLAGGLSTGGSAPVAWWDVDAPATVWVSNDGLRRSWERFFHEKPPSHVSISRALKRLSRQEKPARIRIEEKRTLAYPIPVDLLDLGEGD